MVFAELDPASAAGRTMTRSGHFDTTKTYKIKGKFYTYTTVLYKQVETQSSDNIELDTIHYQYVVRVFFEDFSAITSKYLSKI